MLSFHLPECFEVLTKLRPSRAIEGSDLLSRNFQISLKSFNSTVELVNDPSAWNFHVFNQQYVEVCNKTLEIT